MKKRRIYAMLRTHDQRLSTEGKSTEGKSTVTSISEQRADIWDLIQVKLFCSAKKSRLA